MALSLFLGLQLGTAPLTLDEVRGSARENLQVLTAALDAEGAGHARTQARAAILPRLDLTAGSLAAVASPQLRVATLPKPQADGSTVYEQTTVEVRSDPQLPFSLGLQVSQLLYDGGRWWSRLAQAGAQADAARGQLDEQRLASELGEISRFYELVRAQLTLKILRAAVARSLEQLARASALYEAGRVQRRDVLDAQVNVGNNRIAVLRQEQQVSTGRVDLLQLE